MEETKRLDRSLNFWLTDKKHMKRELKPAEREAIVAAIAAGDRVKATSVYLSATEGNLSEAQNFVRTLMEERALALQAEEKAG
jgi:DNA-binding GntR family transcriptional regulator